MNKILLSFICVCLLSYLCFSQSERPALQLNGGLIIPKEENLQSGLESSFGLALPLGKNISLAVEFAYAKSSTKEEGNKLHNGTLTLTPFLIAVQYEFCQEKSFSPYFSLGAGYIFSSFKIGSYISIPEIRINQKVKSGIGCQFGGGVRFKLTKALSLLCEADYFIRRASAETIISDMNFGVSFKYFSIDLNALLLKLGLKYFL